MRQGFELAFSTSYLFAKSQPSFVALDDITFYKPVEIGDILKLKSTVTYTEGRFLLVEVIASTTNPELGKSQLTNIFYFTFKCPNANENVIRHVMPHSYAEAMKFLEGLFFFLFFLYFFLYFFVFFFQFLSIFFYSFLFFFLFLFFGFLLFSILLLFFYFFLFFLFFILFCCFLIAV